MASAAPSPHERMRLDRFVSQSTGLSRAHVKRLLHAGSIQLNGASVRDAGRLLDAADTVTLEGAALEWPRPRYVMLHKPAGYVCSTEDSSHPLVTDLVDAPWAHTLHAAGRLDADTTGLVLLTSDGDWSHALTSPRREHWKTYFVRLKHPLQADLVQRFADGLMLNSESRPTLPSRLTILDTHTARLSIQEGRYHQVKRMFAACGNRVESLHRESVGAIVLDPALKPGGWRELDPAEIGSAHDG